MIINKWRHMRKKETLAKGEKWHDRHHSHKNIKINISCKNIYMYQ